MEAYACRVYESQGQEDQEFKVIFSYTASLRLEWVHETLSQKAEKEAGKGSATK